LLITAVSIYDRKTLKKRLNVKNAVGYFAECEEEDCGDEIAPHA
jgi:hypothetical protein